MSNLQVERGCATNLKVIIASQHCDMDPVSACQRCRVSFLLPSPSLPRTEDRGVSFGATAALIGFDIGERVGDLAAELMVVGTGLQPAPAFSVRGLIRQRIASSF